MGKPLTIGWVEYPLMTPFSNLPATDCKLAEAVLTSCVCLLLKQKGGKSKLWSDSDQTWQVTAFYITAIYKCVDKPPPAFLCSKYFDAHLQCSDRLVGNISVVIWIRSSLWQSPGSVSQLAKLRTCNISLQVFQCAYQLVITDESIVQFVIL